MASKRGLHCLCTAISMDVIVKMKNPPETPKTRNGLIQMIRMDNSTGQTGVNSSNKVHNINFKKNYQEIS